MSSKKKQECCSRSPTALFRPIHNYCEFPGCIFNTKVFSIQPIFRVNLFSLSFFFVPEYSCEQVNSQGVEEIIKCAATNKAKDESYVSLLVFRPILCMLLFSREFQPWLSVVTHHNWRLFVPLYLSVPAKERKKNRNGAELRFITQ